MQTGLHAMNTRPESGFSPQVSGSVDPNLLIHADHFPGIVLVSNHEGHHTYSNPRGLEYTGLTLDNMQDGSWGVTIHEGDRDRILKEWSHGVSARLPLDFEFRWRRHDGVFRWFRAQVHHILGKHGELIRSYSLLFDIHEQKTAEHTLAENERKFREIVDKAPTGIWMADNEGGIIFGNQSIVAYTGQTLADWGGHGWNKCLHPDDAPIAWDRWHACIDSGSSYRDAYRLRGQNGAYRWFQTAGEPLRDASGIIVSWIGAHIDIDDRVKTEEALRETGQQLRVLVDTIPALVWCATPGGAPDYFNKRMVEYTGLRADHWESADSTVVVEDHTLSHRWLDIIHRDDFVALLPVWEQALATGDSFSASLRLRRADGSYKWFQTFGEPLRDSTGRIVCWYGLNIDIDENKRTEELLRITRSQLAKATQIATIAELSAAIAHEINQPLAAVVANADACAAWLASPSPNLERARLAVESIANDGHAASTVLSRVRSLFQQAKPQKRPLNLNDVIIETLKLLNDDLSRKGIGVELRLERLKVVSADRVHLHQVLTNLLANAGDAMQFSVIEPKTVIISSRMKEQNVMISISDSGPGVSETEKIFDSFFTTKETGLGMGLSICRSIVEAHGGNLWLEENSERGATFSFSIPVEE
jgi:PAS domain S-box-containing protein